ncbi:ABC transporter substrate-binding protein [Nocardioides sp. LMS-CY]|uniref:ABC transporter substrate-binding protein n=1 Tax=Nocardioides sp. (strain LMS-CY) TaxID=2840457 RepID=UPI001C0055A2|nr:ABC transporter substrate-binding protein [Nocardioides sp. LMS-CY]QWF21217.1 ABC transporter substrate-binding protein [Nocardioides sp. LMS-CY]
MIKKLCAVGTVLAAALAVTTGCSDDSSTSSASGDEVTRLVQVNADPSLAATVAFHTSVPEEMGYFADEGLEVEVQGIDGAETAAAMVQSGQADVVQAGGPAMVQFAADKPDGLVAVYLNKSHSFRVVVPEDSDIRTAADLKGKTIGSVALAGSLYQYGRAVVEQGDLDPDSDVKWLPVGYGTQAAAAFQDGKIDAYAGADVFNAVIGSLIGSSMRVIEVPSDTLPAFGAWLFRREMVEEQPEVVAGFIRATLRGMIFTDANPARAVDIHWKAYPSSKPTDADKDGVAEFWQDVVQERLELTYLGTGEDGLYGTASDEQLTTTFEFQVGAEMLPEMPDLDVLVDLGLAEDYNDFDADEVRAEAEAS